MRSSYTRFLVAPLVGAVLAAAPVPTAAQDKKQAEKVEQAQRAEAQALVVLVDDMASGKPVQPGLAFQWEQNHFIKAQADKTYVPFTLAFDPGAVTTPGVGVYLRVMKKGSAPEAPAPVADPKKKDKDKDKEKADVRSHYPFEDLFFIDLPTAVAGQPQRLRRAFAVPPGEYDVYVAVKERAAASSTASAAPPAATAGAAPTSMKLGVVKHELTVPDLSAEFTTSSIIVADKVEVLQAPLPPDQQAINPYTFGQMKITPAASSTFSKKVELSIVFWIYGAGSDATTKKPDVTIDFKFNKKNGDAYEYFNKTEPQALNAQTLPPQFDLAAGHQLPGSLAVPLASFPEGDYRLDIELVDKTTNKTLKRDVSFTVVP